MGELAERPPLHEQPARGSRSLSRSAWGALCALCALAAVAAVAILPAVAEAKVPACPPLKAQQVSRALGFKFVSVDGNAGTHPTMVNCFYTLAKNGGMSLKAWAGTAQYRQLKATIDENIGTINMNDDQSADAGSGACKPARGQCKGTQYNGHESPLSGLGGRALGFPGNKQAGALVMFTFHGNTICLTSNGPKASPGPTEAQLIAFARLLTRSHYSV
jgi:hypothetical protein